MTLSQEKYLIDASRSHEAKFIISPCMEQYHVIEVSSSYCLALAKAKKAELMLIIAKGSDER